MGEHRAPGVQHGCGSHQNPISRFLAFATLSHFGSSLIRERMKAPRIADLEGSKKEEEQPNAWMRVKRSRVVEILRRQAEAKGSKRAIYHDQSAPRAPPETIILDRQPASRLQTALAETADRFPGSHRGANVARLPAGPPALRWRQSGSRYWANLYPDLTLRGAGSPVNLL